MTTYYDDMSESAALNYLAGTTDFGDAAAIRLIAAYIDAATGDGSPEGAVTGGVGDLYTDSTNGHLYIKGSGAGTNTGWVQLESATSGSGDVNGPGSATDNALVRFDGTDGKTVQNSGITVDDSNNITSDLTISKASPVLNINTSAIDQTADINFKENGALRWWIRKDGSAEDLTLYRTSDGGASNGVVQFKRDTGKVLFASVGATAGLELGSSGPRVMSDTGSPEGVVTAPVGSQWIDTAATTGAIKWIKASGTGNTGWVVEHGDTGWRQLSSLLINGWAAGADGLYVRRRNDYVEWHFNGVTGAAKSAQDMLAAITGFRPHKAPAYNSPFVYSDNGNTAQVWHSNTSTIQSSATGSIYGTFGHLTSDAWPSSLPGSAA